MPSYRVRPGATLPHAGAVHDAGAIVELPRAIATDPAVAGLIDEVDAAGQLVAPAPMDDLERFRSHERVSILRDRIAAAQAVVTDLEARLAREEQTLTDLVTARTAAAAPATPVAPKTGATKKAEE